MRKTLSWTKRNLAFVGMVITAAGFTTPAASYAIKVLPRVLPTDLWKEKMAPFSVSMIVFSLTLKLVLEVYLLTKKHIVPAVRQSSFPRYFCALGMFWPKRVSREVWEPAFEDELARYLELKPRSDVRILNLCFAWRMIWVILPTLVISLTDWRLVFLSRKKRE